MKNFSIQSLALAVVIVMIYAAPCIIDREMLEHILKETHNSTYKKWENKTVPKASGFEPRCVENFLCLAEKSLKTIHELAHSKLVRRLHQYNNKTENGTCCTLDQNTKYYFKALLEDIQYCVKKKLECRNTH